MRKIFFIALAAMTTACSDYFFSEVDLPQEAFSPELAIEAVMNDTAGYFDVYVTETYSPKSAISYQTIGNAEIALYKNGQLINRKDSPHDTIRYNGTDTLFTYRLYAQYEAGEQYELRVKAPGYDLATSTITSPANPVHLTATATESPRSEEYMVVFDLEAELFDVPQDVVYELRLMIEDTLKNYLFPGYLYSVQPFSFEYDPWGGSVEFFGEYLSFDNDIFSNGPVDFRFEATFFNFSENLDYEDIQIVLSTYPKEYYLYRYNLTRQSFSEGDPFVEPVPVVGNFSNALGAFGARVTLQQSL